MGDSGVHTRTSGKPAGNPPSAYTPATPYAGKKETKQATIERLRSQRDVLLAKKSAAAEVEEQLREEVVALRQQLAKAQQTSRAGLNQTSLQALTAKVSAMQTAA